MGLSGLGFTRQDSYDDRYNAQSLGVNRDKFD